MTKDSRKAVRECRHHQRLKRSFCADSDSEGFNRKAISSLDKEISDYLALKCEKKFDGRERFKRYGNLEKEDSLSGDRRIWSSLTLANTFAYNLRYPGSQED
uniref:Uncharacterized protein n=1 Tax=Ascaris lumbricoides TaxID=6252 RepID=A0A0M3II57_ASCLU